MALVDCNGNGISDSVDIPNPLAGDLNGDTHVNAEDLGTLLARWGLVPESAESHSSTNDLAPSPSLRVAFFTTSHVAHKPIARASNMPMKRLKAATRTC